MPAVVVAWHYSTTTIMRFEVVANFMPNFKSFNIKELGKEEDRRDALI